MPIFWALQDDRAGNNSQVQGVARHFGRACEVKKLNYNIFINIPGLLGLNRLKGSPLTPPWPDAVISAGRRASRIALHIKNMAAADGKKPLLVQIMKPESGMGKFDIVALPAHDAFSPKKCGKSVILQTLLSPHSITAETLAQQRFAWAAKFPQATGPRIAVLVGGNSKNAKYSADNWLQFKNYLENLRANLGGSFMFTTSRRTGEQATALFAGLCGKPNDVFHPWSAKPGKPNPYQGFLALADAIIVTGDSVSMCSEAIATGKAVYVFTGDKCSPPKFERFLKALYTGNHAKPFVGEVDLSWKPAPAPDAAEQIAEAINALLAKKG